MTRYDQHSGSGAPADLGAGGSRRLGVGVALAAVLVCLICVAACAGTVTAGSRRGVTPVVQKVSHEEVALKPSLEAGAGGWCVSTPNDGPCPSLLRPVYKGPVVLELWNGRGSPPVREGIVLTTSEATAVSFEGGASIPTRPEPGLPDGLRAAVLELRGGATRQVFGETVPPPSPRAHFVALNAKGERLASSGVAAAPLAFQVSTRSWSHGESPARGICALEAQKLPGLAEKGGGVIRAVVRHANVRGREFVDCLRTRYVFQGWPLEANVLLDAANPGSEPGSLSYLRRLTGHPDVFVEPGHEGDSVARRVNHAWILVSGGKDLQQRLSVLEHLRITLRL
jgi:hypothetical protein